MNRLPLAFCLFAAAGATGAGASETHPFSIHDMVAMQRISDPQPSPDGTKVAFVLRTTDLDANRGRTDIHLIGIDGKGHVQLTAHEASDSSPRWAPDGTSIYFLSSRSGSSQVWRIPIDGGEAVRVTDFPLDVSAFVLSPQGTHLALGLEVFPDCATLACTKERLDAEAKRKSSGRIYDTLFFRHWDTWKDGRRAHVWIAPVAGGDLVDVMKGMDADCPTKPFGGAEDIAFTPDGKGVVFVARNVGRTEAWSTDFDLWLAPIDGSKAPVELTAPNEAWDSTPVFSPDGKTLAYLAMARPGYEADRRRIVVRAWPNGEPRVVTEGWDRSASSITWSADGKTIFTTAEDIGQGAIFAIDVASGSARVVHRDGNAGAPGLAGGKLVFGLDSLRSPVELHAIEPSGRGLTRITTINDERLAKARMGTFEQFSFKGALGHTVYGYIVKPADFDAAKKYPVAFLIHGGPQGSFGNHFHYRWNPQAYAGRGYAAVMIDFHGSTGYGQAFTDAIRSDWGGKPLEDLKLGLAAAIEKYPFLDGDRVAALGASYGGYMINWIAGRWPDRFRCLVTHDGNLDERFAYFDTEELWFPEWDHEGTPWDNPEGYSKHNPIEHVAKWKTPTLVVHGALDFRVVETQGMATFTALQRRGIPSKFLYFPDENHWVLKPHNSILWHDTVLDWLDQWTKAR